MATSPQRGRDYYDEHGRVVFTSYYHLKRGSCCGSGCRHCPYDSAGRPRAEFAVLLAQIARESEGARGPADTD